MSSLKTQIFNHFPEICKGFLYLSPWKSLVTKGCYTTITSPIFDGSILNGTFQKKIKYSLNLAKKQGINNPIVVGAIPFDIFQKSSLFIPESYQMFNRTNLLSSIFDNKLTLKNFPNILYIPNHDFFIKMVNKALLEIKKGTVEKIVLSRLVDIITDNPINISNLMKQIIIQNPNSYQFYLPLLQGGTLLGASPELVLRKEGHYFISCPLAGSIKRKTKNTIHDYILAKKLINSKKNRYEHDIVIQSIRYNLLPRSNFLIVPKIPSVISTSTLLHLSTKIYGKILDVQENSLSLASLLHPTPALNGFPHNNAYQLIKEIEPFKRQFFGGIIGWGDIYGNGEWVVIIRCGVVNKNYLRLFAGAGIVKNSKPELEWQETNLKLQLMLNALVF